MPKQALHHHKPTAGGALSEGQPPCIPPGTGTTRASRARGGAPRRATVPRRCRPFPFASGGNIRGLTGRPALAVRGTPVPRRGVGDFGRRPVQRGGCPELSERLCTARPTSAAQGSPSRATFGVGWTGTLETRPGGLHPDGYLRMRCCARLPFEAILAPDSRDSSCFPPGPPSGVLSLGLPHDRPPRALSSPRNTVHNGVIAVSGGPAPCRSGRC